MRCISFLKNILWAAAPESRPMQTGGVACKIPTEPQKPAQGRAPVLSRYSHGLALFVKTAAVGQDNPKARQDSSTQGHTFLDDIKPCCLKT